MSSTQRSDDLPQSPNPASTLLQDLLREKKAENRRLSRVTDTDPRRVASPGSVFDDRDVQSSPVPPPSRDGGNATHARRTSAYGGRDLPAPKGMGMREMEQVGHPR